MGRRCTVCSHPDRPAVDQMLVNFRSFRSIAARFSLSPQALLRHHDDHLPEALVKAKEAEDIRHAIDHVAQFKALNGATVAILAEARRLGDHDLALRAIDRLQRQIELQLRVIGELDERPQINLLVSAEWLAVRAAVLEALKPYPEARVAVAEHLMRLEAAA